MTQLLTKAAELPKRYPLQFTFEALDIQPHRTRAAEGDTDVVEEDVYDVVLSTETPVDRGGYLETLGHEPGEVDLTFARRGITFMLEHGGLHRSYAPNPAYHLGVLEELRVEGKKLKATARFAADDALSEDAIRIKRDWKTGKPTRLFMSIGWGPIARTVTEPTKAGEMLKIRWTKWQPREGSNVAIPADPRSGKERSASMEEPEFEVEDAPTTTQHRSQEATPMDPTTVTPTPTPSAPAAAPPAGAGAAVAEATQARNAEVAQIVSLCVAQNCASRASEFINAGLSLARVKETLFDELATRNAATRTVTPGSEALEGLSPKDRARYSFRKAALMGLRSGAVRREGLEFQVHQQLAKSLPPGWETRGGILVPFDLRSEQEIVDAWERKLEHRTMETKVAGKGAEWVGDQQMPLVEMLEAATVMARLGANFNTALTGSLSYPRETGQPTVAFQGENPGVNQTLTDAATGEILSGPKMMIGGVKMSRQWLHQTAGAGESRVRNGLVNGTSRALDRAGFHGTGAGSQPTGLYSLAGVNSVAMGAVAPTLPKITDMGGKISDQNADLGRMGWATTALLAWFLRAKLEFSAAGSQPIWTGPIADGMIAGYRAIGSTQLSKVLGAGADEHGFVFGNWAYCDINLWGGTELVVDELTLGDQALVVIRSYGMGDVVFTHPEAFCVATAAKPA